MYWTKNNKASKRRKKNVLWIDVREENVVMKVIEKHVRVNDYITKYGDRNLEELKIEAM